LSLFICIITASKEPFKIVARTRTNPSFSRRRPEPPQPVQLAPAAQEEAKVADGLHQPPDLRAGEEVPLPEVPQSGGPRRDRLLAGPDQRTSHHLVPEQEGQAQTRHGGAQEGRRERQAAHRAQELPRERPGLGDTQEEGHHHRRRLSEEPGRHDGQVTEVVPLLYIM
jgi:hypothetical protein